MANNNFGMSGADMYAWFLSLESVKSDKLTLMDQIDEFFNPNDSIYTGKQFVGLSENKGELLDTTGTDLIDEYVSYVLGIQYNAQDRWFTLYSPNLKFTDPDALVLEKRAEKLYKLIAGTNYYSQCPLLERDTLVQGHGMMIIEPSETALATTYTKDPKTVFFAQTEDGEVYASMYKSQLTGMQIIEKFNIGGDVDYAALTLINENQLSRYQLLTMVLPNKAPFQDAEGLKKENKGKKYEIRHLLYDVNGDLKGLDGFSNLDPKGKSSAGIYTFAKRSFLDHPIVFPCRDTIARSHPYGLGIGRKALPKSRILNKLKANLLNFSALQANPPRMQTTQLTQEIGDVQETNNPLKEGQVFITPIDHLNGTHNIRPIELLQVTGDLTGIFEMYTAEQGQLASLLPVAGQVYKTARQSVNEIEQRLSEQEKRLAPIRANYLREATTRHLREFYRLAEKKGEFNSEEFQFTNPDTAKNIDFQFDSFLLGKYKESKALRVARAVQLSANVLSLSPTAADYVNGDDILKMTFAGFSVLDMLKSDQEVTVQREQTAQLQQQQQLLQQQGAFADSTKAIAGGLESIDKVIQGG